MTNKFTDANELFTKINSHDVISYGLKQNLLEIKQFETKLT